LQLQPQLVQHLDHQQLQPQPQLHQQQLQQPLRLKVQRLLLLKLPKPKKRRKLKRHCKKTLILMLIVIWKASGVAKSGITKSKNSKAKLGLSS